MVRAWHKGIKRIETFDKDSTLLEVNNMYVQRLTLYSNLKNTKLSTNEWEQSRYHLYVYGHFIPDLISAHTEPFQYLLFTNAVT